MKKRVISAVVLIALIAICMPFEISRIIFFGACGILCAYELVTNLKKVGVTATGWVLYTYMAVQIFLTVTHCGLMAYIAWFTAAVFLSLLSGVIHKDVGAPGALCTLAGLSYPCFPYALIMIISISARWVQTLSIACVSVILCDSFALFGGSRFGKHKLAPNTSPNKTIEGSICGTLASLIGGLALYFISLNHLPIPLIPCLVTSLASSTLGQVGDLAESLIKRYLGIKDFSDFIPGHGGVFDRSDSMMFAIPTAYLCFYLFGL